LSRIFTKFDWSSPVKGHARGAVRLVTHDQVEAGKAMTCLCGGDHRDRLARSRTTHIEPVSEAATARASEAAFVVAGNARSVTSGSATSCRLRRRLPTWVSEHTAK